jgi:hypothetical protein
MKRLLTAFSLFITVQSHAQWTGTTDINNTNSGNVGIGTTTPSEKLEVNGNLKATKLVSEYITKYPSDNFTHNGLTGHHYGLGWVADPWQAGGNTAWLSGFGGVKIFTGGVPIVSVSNSGLVGIGEDVVLKHKLNVGDAGNVNDNQTINFRSYSNGLYWKGAGAFGYSSASVILGELFGVATIGGHNPNLSDWRTLAINPGGGSVGIATTLPEAKLHINGDVRVKSPSVIYANAGGRNPLFLDAGNFGHNSSVVSFVKNANTIAEIGTDLNVDGSTNMYLHPQNNASILLNPFGTGTVGIGTSNPGAKLEVADGAADPFKYGAVQITRPASPGDDKFHLSFIRAQNTVSGIGFVSGTNTFGIWASSSSNSANLPSICFTTGQNVGIGTVNPQEKLSVNGTVLAKKVRVSINSVDWPDFVFEPGYRLNSLAWLEAYVKTNKHLPDVPSSEEVGKNGADLGNNQAILLKKIEELTLYLIEQNKKIESLEKQVKELKQQ